jgi:Ca2+-binding RTX toxin-like protein
MSSIVSWAAGDSSPVNVSGAGLEVVGSYIEENEIRVVSGEAPVTIIGGATMDTLVGGEGNDTIMGLKGNDLIEGLGGDDVLLGGDGDDKIAGGDGADLIVGGKGSDTISGDMGADTMMGGLGADIFEFAADEFDAVDTIQDLDKGKGDIIKITGGSSVTYDEETGIISVDGQSAIDIGAGMDIGFQDTDQDGTWELF